MKALWISLAVLLSASLPALAAPMSEFPGQSCGAKLPIHLQPIMSTHTLPPYPPEAVKMRAEGTSLITVLIDPGGHVQEDSLTQSSGSSVLDLAALDFVKANWQWQPIPDCTMPVSTRVSIKWDLRPATPIDPALLVKLLHFIPAAVTDYPPGVPQKKSIVMMMGIVSETGAWEKVNAMAAFGDPALQAKSEELARTHHWTPPQLDGKPVGAVTVIGVIWTPPGETPVDPDQIGKVMELFLQSQKK